MSLLARHSLLCVFVCAFSVVLHAQQTDDPQDSFELEGIPETPAEVWEAAKFMFRLGRHEDARNFLVQLLDSDIPEELLISIGESADFAILGRMKNSPTLREPALALLRRVESAVRSRVRSPERIRKMIDYLSRSPAHRTYAIEQLRAAGPYAVPHLIAHLANLPDGPQRARLLQSMTRLSDTAVPALLAVLDSNDWRLRRDVLLILSRIGTPYAARALRYYAESPEVRPSIKSAARNAIEKILGRPYSSLPSAHRDLLALAQHHYGHEHRWLVEADGNVALWRWVPENGLKAFMVLPEEADLYETLRFSRQAYLLKPSSAWARGLLLAAGLELQQRREEQQQTAASLAAVAWAGAEANARALSLALEHGRLDTAQTLLELWSGVSDASKMFANPSVREAIELALFWPDAQIRLAAIETVLQAQPTRPFTGLSVIPRLLAPLLRASGPERSVFILTGRPNDIRHIVQWWRERDTKVVVVEDITELLSQPLRGANAIVVVIPPVHEDRDLLLSKLRRHPELALYPVVWVAEEPDNGSRVPLGCLTHRLPGAPEDLESLEERVLRLSRRLSEADTAQVVERAAQWLKRLARGEIPALTVQAALPVMIGELRRGETGLLVAEALGYVNDPGAQEALLQVGLDKTVDVELRLAALKALRQSVRRYGKLVQPEVDWRAVLADAAEEENLLLEVVRVAGCFGVAPELARDALLEFAPTGPEP